MHAEKKPDSPQVDLQILFQEEIAYLSPARSVL